MVRIKRSSYMWESLENDILQQWFSEREGEQSQGKFNVWKMVPWLNRDFTRRSRFGQGEDDFKFGRREFVIPVTSSLHCPSGCKPLKCGSFELRCAVSVKYTPDSNVLVPKKVKYFIINFFVLLSCWNDNMLDMLG